MSQTNYFLYKRTVTYFQESLFSRSFKFVVPSVSVKLRSGEICLKINSVRRFSMTKKRSDRKSSEHGLDSRRQTF